MAKGLGRGLGALLGEEPVNEESPKQTLRISEIEPNPDQPRHVFDEAALMQLADSIKENGLLQPIAVRKNGSVYQIIAGERRWRAARKAGLLEVPVVVLEADDRRAVELGLIENLQREDLNPIEEAASMKMLTDRFGMTQEQVAARVGRSRSAVANAMRILSLPDAVRVLVEEGRLSGGHARALLLATRDEDREKLAELAVKNGLNVRQLEKLAAAAAKAAENEGTGGEENEDPEAGVNHLEETQNRLSGTLGRRVTFHPGKKKGFVTIEFYGNDDLENLISMLDRLN